MPRVSISARARDHAVESLRESIEVEAMKAAAALCPALERWRALGSVPDAALNAWDKALGFGAAAAVCGEQIPVHEVFAQHLGKAWPYLKAAVEGRK